MKKVKLNPDQIRQGDVLIEMLDERQFQKLFRGAGAVTDAPEGIFQMIPRDSDGSVTLAHGEVTGHRHRFVARFEGDGESMLYAHPTVPTEPSLVKLDVPRDLMHEEHRAPTIPAGLGRISRPYEYEGAELLRRVED